MTIKHIYIHTAVVKLKVLIRKRYSILFFFYFFNLGLRKVYPYYFTFTTFTKGRWVNQNILDVFAREFRAHPAEEYVSTHCVFQKPKIAYISKCCYFLLQNVHFSTYINMKVFIQFWTFIFIGYFWPSYKFFLFNDFSFFKIFYTYYVISGYHSYLL